MSIVQSTFTEDLARGYPGMQADGSLANILTGHLEGATACEFGRPVYQGSADKGLTLTVSANLIGIALARKGLPVTEDRAADTYAPGDNVPVLERGVVFVTSISAAAKGAQVYVTSGGEITDDSGGNTAATGWEFDLTTSAPGLTRIARR
jgi:hypothetical protein